jgi:uncharacterized damage-inducible protein DinB
MSCHPLVKQLRFTRQEFVRCVREVSPEDAVRRVLPLNCISWVIGHVANQEQRFWVSLAQNRLVVPGLNDLVGSGKPASTPPPNEMWTAWQAITKVADVYLDTVTAGMLQTYFIYDGKSHPESIGTMLLRNIYHYWYHTGEAHATRDMLGHLELPRFVGDMPSELYSP